MQEKKPSHFVWLDLEMTGLNPDVDRILEIATVVTDTELNIVAEGPSLAIHQAETILATMDAWVTKTHTESGLVERVRKSTITEEEAQAQTLEFLHKYLKAKESPMCGNTICQDRRFLYRWMPRLEQFFHYRNLDVSSLKILAQHWAPAVPAGLKKDSRHLALQDVYDSIAELQHYKKEFIKL